MPLRIIAGKYKGRLLTVPKDKQIRPTASPVKEAFFSILQQKVMEAKVLDLFAGSGSLGLEALSRGAKEVIFCDNSPIALKTIKENLKKINPEETTTVIKAFFPRDFKILIPFGPYDLILLDPPYALRQIALDFLKFSLANKILNNEAYVIWEQDPENLKILNKTEVSPFEILLTRHWGDRGAVFLSRNDGL